MATTPARILDPPPLPSPTGAPAKKKWPNRDYTIENLTEAQKLALNTFDRDFSRLKSQIQKTQLCALLFFVPSILVLFVGCLCTTLPGANVMTEVCLKAFLPGGLGLSLSIPIFYQSYKPSNEKRTIRENWLNKAKEILDTKLIKPENIDPEDDGFEREGGRFIQFNLIPKGNQIYQNEFLRELKEFYKDDKEPKAECIKKAIDEATGNIARGKGPPPINFSMKNITEQ